MTKPEAQPEKFCAKCWRWRSTVNASGSGRQYRCGVCTLARMSRKRQTAQQVPA